MRLTLLEADARSGGVRVQLDGRPFGTIGPADVAALNLTHEGEVSDATVEDLARRAEAYSALVVALRMLEARALPSLEIKRRLTRKGHSKVAADAAVRSLGESGLINDFEFACHYARTRSRRQRFGPRRLVADLRRMGVADRDAEAAVRDALDADGVEARDILREAAAKKARTLAGLDPVVARRRLRSYLLRRGFAGAEISTVAGWALQKVDEKG